MKQIALAILIVGLCFYEAYLKVNNKEIDVTASLVAIIASVMLLLSK